MCAVVVALLPAWRIGRGALRPALNAGGRTDHAGGGGLRHLLIVGQISASVALVAVALILTRSFVRLLAVDPGFEASHVLTLRTSLPENVYRDGHSIVAAYSEMRHRLAQIPGAFAVGAAAGLPLASLRGDTGLRIAATPNVRGSADWQVVTPGYFEALGTPLRSGRAFTDGDVQGMQPVAVVNETLSRVYFRGRNPLGERIAVGVSGGWCTIVGVVADVHHRGLDAAPRPEVTSRTRSSGSADRTVPGYRR